jgi:predicted ATPase
VLERAGDYESAAAALAEAEMAIDASNERWWEAKIHRLKGVLLQCQGNVALSESCFKRSIRIARQQQANSLELRAATSLARLWGERAGGLKHVISSHPFTAGLPRALTPLT